MNRYLLSALIAALVATGALAVPVAHAVDIEDELCINCTLEESRMLSDKSLRDDIPISIMTEKVDYSHNEMIRVMGHVANPAGGFPITVIVTSPLNSIIEVAQVTPSQDGSFEATMNTAGPLWKYDGIYVIKASYGEGGKSDSTKIMLSGGVPWTPTFETPDDGCGDGEFSILGQCVPFEISGGMIADATVNTGDNSIVLRIDSADGGMLTLTPPKSVQDGIFMVLVDGEESNDLEISDNMVTVAFPAGTEKIEVIGTFVIPEFGTIAVMVLVVAIISIVAVSARSRLSIIPRY